MSETKRIEEVEVAGESIERDAREPTKLSVTPLIELGRVSEETHGLTGNHFEGFTAKP